MSFLRRATDRSWCSGRKQCQDLWDPRGLPRSTTRAAKSAGHSKRAANSAHRCQNERARPPWRPRSNKSAADCSAQKRCRFGRGLLMAIPARSLYPSDRLRHLSDKGHCPVRSKEGKCSTVACASATSSRKSFSDFLARTPNRSLRCFHREREFFASSFLHLSNGRRLAPGSARKHDPARRRKLCLSSAGPRGSARSAANHPALCASTSCRRPWTCTFHSRRKSRSACRLLRTQRRSRSNLTAQPRSPQSMQSSVNRRWDSTFVPRQQSSKCLLPRFRNRKLPAARAHPPPPVRVPREVARSAATAALERV